jgi:hypothetical protein
MRNMDTAEKKQKKKKRVRRGFQMTFPPPETPPLDAEEEAWLQSQVQRSKKPTVWERILGILTRRRRK